MNINIQKVTNDTYLKLFDSNLIKSLVKPSDKNKMKSEITLQLNHENYDFDVSLLAYEELSGTNCLLILILDQLISSLQEITI